ncbi:hypothetical protein AB0M79_27585 [Polymorphospora sp. NPDC051019]|uniref:hypothetical protein n=1 Tax=Polymorphospora sp. NPDC051019 TaxID=3155725 RepID=UPI0034140D76
MPRKPFTTRTALITATAMTTGATAGTIADTITAHLGYTGPEVGPATTAIIAIWILDKLNTLIDDR